jgi:hypothetical protein
MQSLTTWWLVSSSPWGETKLALPLGQAHAGLHEAGDVGLEAVRGQLRLGQAVQGPHAFGGVGGQAGQQQAG